MERDFSEFDFTVKESRALSEQERGELLRLFELNYRQANPAFLEKSLATLRHSGSAIAEAYGVRDFDPETFVCIGGGTPTGYPRIEFDVEPHEWEVFKPVDRDRGDALLAIAWVPDYPPDW
jgi:hypothetical protein